MKIGNILSADENIICHQVNCQGVMGAGLAKQIKQQYPKMFTVYKNMCKSENRLGQVFLAHVKPDKYVANIFSQDKYGRGLQTDYSALRKGLQMVNKYANENNLSVAIPYKIGCGLAGGDWNVVKEIIQDTMTCKYEIYKL